MGQNLAKSIFLVLSAQGRPVGTGFLVAPRLGVTCAHVVRVTLDLQADDPRGAFGQDLAVRAYGSETVLQAGVLQQGWSPNTTGDVAFLRFHQQPGELQPVRLGCAALSAQHAAITLGYPGSEAGQALFAQGQILGLLGDRDSPRVQFESHTVEPGFSGSPILDLEQDRVVAMVSRGKDPQHAVTVWAAPAELLKDLWPELALIEPPSAAPFMVEALPEHFVARPQEFEQIVSALLTSAPDGPVGISAALKGAGGFGKTTLARAVCWDECVRAAFPSGNLWVTLGENPSELATVTDHLRVLLKNRKVLLVEDDAWRAEHLRPFLQPAARAVLLVTTRNADTLPEHTIKIDVDAMRQDEALSLLRAGLPAGCRPRRGLHLARWPAGWVNGLCCSGWPTACCSTRWRTAKACAMRWRM